MIPALNPVNYELRALLAKALSNTSRLQILDALNHRELCVNQITEIVGLDQSTISKHLSILKNVGLIKHRCAGTTHYYSCACTCIDDFFKCFEKLDQSACLPWK